MELKDLAKTPQATRSGLPRSNSMAKKRKETVSESGLSSQATLESTREDTTNVDSENPRLSRSSSIRSNRSTTSSQVSVPPDSPKWAVFYFVLYTIFSTYNLIAGKFFRTWYPQMSTF